jgi:alkylated DNA repair dioxygenase AlkB
VAFFGRSYDAGGAPTPPIPPFLEPLRTRLAEIAGVDRADFVMALVNEFPAGAPIGWHRDAPQYGVVAGVCLLSPCRLMFRPYARREARASNARRVATHEIVLEPRSAYVMKGPARQAYEHHIPPVTSLRYSVTFRTARS